MDIISFLPKEERVISILFSILFKKFNNGEINI